MIIPGQKRFTFMAAGLAAAVTAALLPAAALPVLSHGGKQHGGSYFSSFQAVQKAAELYDRLITSGKLEEAWETGLVAITVDTRNQAGKDEYVVRFRRSHGEPDAVYFFFDQRGEYTGSNFSGN